MDFKVTKFSVINEIIIPFFIKNPILGVKSLDFNDWCLVSEIVNKREHKLEQGALKIIEIQRKMNRGEVSKNFNTLFFFVWSWFNVNGL